MYTGVTDISDNICNPSPLFPFIWFPVKSLQIGDTNERKHECLKHGLSPRGGYSMEDKEGLCWFIHLDPIAWIAVLKFQQLPKRALFDRIREVKEFAHSHIAGKYWNCNLNPEINRETKPLLTEDFTLVLLLTEQCHSSHLYFIILGLDIKPLPQDFPGGPVVKNLPTSAKNTGLIPGLGRSHMLWGK